MNAREVKIFQDLAEEVALGGWCHVVAITFGCAESRKIDGDDSSLAAFPGRQNAPAVGERFATGE